MICCAKLIRYQQYAAVSATLHCYQCCTVVACANVIEYVLMLLVLLCPLSEATCCGNQAVLGLSGCIGKTLYYCNMLCESWLCLWL